jgi:hypothetical protein
VWSEEGEVDRGDLLRGFLWRDLHGASPLKLEFPIANCRLPI